MWLSLSCLKHNFSITHTFKLKKKKCGGCVITESSVGKLDEICIVWHNEKLRAATSVWSRVNPDCPWEVLSYCYSYSWANMNNSNTLHLPYNLHSFPSSIIFTKILYNVQDRCVCSSDDIQETEIPLVSQLLSKKTALGPVLPMACWKLSLHRAIFLYFTPSESPV